ncbi:molybdenum cofactor synthesis domain-containing protein [Peptoniphilus asaccharolyticus DSM 20463]|uniref:Molybdopterin molybdenumtransferase n=1 Tax=Peptoniphilus asaccharolyticus DSM 20463 TaxID=573058 RepID=A0A1W1VAT4_PEPAS|nr:molybdopterin-binding protein [Peptoniphilus asaccharolyticus]MBL7575706.1 molybdopterin-binding protein [Peptoniphilus asaccharolyticus]SMB90425.1 molybdenum cofactor synthesis domain-containing protein [Peptoniphilus asaccharolyticus DSM 20463]
MKTIRTEEAVGQVLGHDLTQIIKGVSKGPRFKKGHVIREEDVPVLLEMGKEHIYILEVAEDEYHEEDAAKEIARKISGRNIVFSDVSEGKVNLIADTDGVLLVDVEKLFGLNSITDITIATKFSDIAVKKGEVLAGTRITPVKIKKNVIDEIEDESVVEVLPFKNLKFAIITTGSEVSKGRIEDKFTGVVREKFSQFKFEEIHQEYVTDNLDEISSKIDKAVELGADVVVCTGGMSVDPDDKTPGAIKKSSTEQVTYGTPVLPGAMFMIAYKGNSVLLGLPGSVMYCEKTILDMVLPKIAAGIKLEKKDIVKLGHGGLL